MRGRAGGGPERERERKGGEEWTEGERHASLRCRANCFHHHHHHTGLPRGSEGGKESWGGQEDGGTLSLCLGCSPLVFCSAPCCFLQTFPCFSSSSSVRDPPEASCLLCVSVREISVPPEFVKVTRGCVHFRACNGSRSRQGCHVMFI